MIFFFFKKSKPDFVVMDELLHFRKVSLILEEDPHCSCKSNNFPEETASCPSHVFLVGKSKKGALRAVA